MPTFVFHIIFCALDTLGFWKFWSSVHESKMEMSKCLTITSLMQHSNNLQRLQKPAGLIPCCLFLDDPRTFINLNMRLLDHKLRSPVIRPLLLVSQELVHQPDQSGESH